MNESPETREDNESVFIYDYDDEQGEEQEQEGRAERDGFIYKNNEESMKDPLKELHHDRNLAVTCPTYSSSHYNYDKDHAVYSGGYSDPAKATKDCPDNYRMVAYKCYNDNDKYDFDGGASEMRYTKIDGVYYIKGISCDFQPTCASDGGSTTRAEVFCAPIDEYLEEKTVITSIDTGNLYYKNTASTYVDCGEEYQVASFTCSTTNDKFELKEVEKTQGGSYFRYWGTKSYLEKDPPNWNHDTQSAGYQNRRYDRYAYCTYENQSFMHGFFDLTQSTTITVQARCEKRTCDNW